MPVKRKHGLQLEIPVEVEVIRRGLLLGIEPVGRVG